MPIVHEADGLDILRHQRMLCNDMQQLKRTLYSPNVGSLLRSSGFASGEDGLSCELEALVLSSESVVLFNALLADGIQSFAAEQKVLEAYWH